MYVIIFQIERENWRDYFLIILYITSNGFFLVQVRHARCGYLGDTSGNPSFVDLNDAIKKRPSLFGSPMHVRKFVATK